MCVSNIQAISIPYRRDQRNSHKNKISILILCVDPFFLVSTFQSLIWAYFADLRISLWFIAGTKCHMFFEKIIRVKVTSESTLKMPWNENQWANTRKEREREREGEKNSSVVSIYVQFMVFRTKRRIKAIPNRCVYIGRHPIEWALSISTI